MPRYNPFPSDIVTWIPLVDNRANPDNPIPPRPDNAILLDDPDTTQSHYLPFPVINNSPYSLPSYPTYSHSFESKSKLEKPFPKDSKELISL